MDIIIFGGQSNMQGQSEDLSSVEPVKNAFEYKYLEDKVVPLKNPVGEDIRYDHTPGYLVEKDTKVMEWIRNHVTGSSCYGNTNLVPEFCRTYTEATGNQVLAVHVAKGSTVIAEWLPGSAGYDIILKKATAAIQKVKADSKVGRVFFVWLQGESDAIKGNSKGYYKEKIRELCTALKADVGVEKFGIIRVGYFTTKEKDSEIISAQDEVCLEDGDFLMLTDIATTLNGQSEYMNPFVSGHYSAKGLEKLGFEAGKNLGAFVNSK